MAGSTFGTIFTITTWGESHGEALGVVIDGCPAGLSLSAADIQLYLDRRKPGQSDISTPRKENDEVKILSGVFNGKTTGTPISLMIDNTNHYSADYEDIASIYRPGHADFSYDAKYGFRDYRGGGRSSGRETIGRVAAGAVAAKLLNDLGINFITYTHSIGAIEIADETAKNIFIDKKLKENILSSKTKMPDIEADKNALKLISECKEKGDSIGSVVECRINGVTAGIGEPVFDKLDAKLAQAIMSIGAVKAVEIGDGINAPKAYGSENNDEFYQSGKNIIKKSNHSGGILGGISDGSEIILRIHFKPTPSISLCQQSIDQSGQLTALQIKGRHDPVIGPRAVVVVEAMAAITLLDAMLVNMGSKLNHIKKFYGASLENQLE